MPSTITCSFSPLFSRTGGVRSHLNSPTHRFHGFPPRNLYSLSSLLQQTQPTVKLISLQDRQNRESFLQRLQTFVSGHLLSHSALSSYILSFARSLGSLYELWFRHWGVAQLLGFHAPIPSEGSGSSSNNNK